MLWWATWLLTSAASASPMEDLLVAELDYAQGALASKPEKPYYNALAVREVHETNISATSGTLTYSGETWERYLDVDLRVGSPELDNTHDMRGMSSWSADNREERYVALGDPSGEAAWPLRHAIRRSIDEAWQTASEHVVMVRAEQNVKVAEEDKAPDFSPYEAVTAAVDVPDAPIDRAAWEKVLVEASKTLDQPNVIRSSVALNVDHTTQWFVDTEGRRIRTGRWHARVLVYVTTVAADGESLDVYDTIDYQNPEKLPELGQIVARASAAVDRLAKLEKAPRGEPYSGPVILSGRATGVFFHEVFGHRVEGHRQKRESEGKTFADHVGKPILPSFVSVYDDPTIATREGEDLNGHYAYDDEGVPAQRADLVKNGVFQGFLMSRSPIQGFPKSNGHGRRSPGSPPLARMGNTIVEVSKTVSPAELRRQLIAELRAQKLPYGYIVQEIDGGFTMTGRTMPNAFNVLAKESTRVWTDGRPDEVVRGIDLVGTPLVAFTNVVAASNEFQVFNGVCGAESGWVPVSAVAPAILLKRLEFQLKDKDQERPALLPKPTVPADRVGEVSR